VSLAGRAVRLPERRSARVGLHALCGSRRLVWKARRLTGRQHGALPVAAGRVLSLPNALGPHTGRMWRVRRRAAERYAAGGG